MSSDFSLLRASRDIFLIDLLEPISQLLRDPGTGLHNIDNDQTNRDRDGSGRDVDGNRFSANAREFPQIGQRSHSTHQRRDHQRNGN